MKKIALIGIFCAVLIFAPVLVSRAETVRDKSISQMKSSLAIVYKAVLDVQSKLNAISSAPTSYPVLPRTGTSTPTLTVLYPNGGETWAVGSEKTITWSSTDIPTETSVIIKLQTFIPPTTVLERDLAVSSNDGDETIIVPADYGGFPTTTPIRLGNYHKVWIMASVTGFPTDQSDQTFTIIDPDVNNDGVVNVNDLLLVINNWGTCASSICPADVNGDGMVDNADVNLIISNWWTNPPTLTMSNQSMTAASSSLPFLANLTASFRLTANGQAFYVGRAPGLALATSTTAFNTHATGLFTVAANTCLSCGDTAAYFGIPDGYTRNLTYTGQINNLGGIVGAKNFKITKVYYDDDTTGLREFNFSGPILNALSVDVVLTGD